MSFISASVICVLQSFDIASIFYNFSECFIIHYTLFFYLMNDISFFFLLKYIYINVGVKPRLRDEINNTLINIK
jgi:hypothetical protein